jgi:hypothetical protein
MKEILTEWRKFIKEEKGDPLKELAFFLADELKESGIAASPAAFLKVLKLADPKILNKIQNLVYKQKQSLKHIFKPKPVLFLMKKAGFARKLAQGSYDAAAGTLSTILSLVFIIFEAAQMFRPVFYQKFIDPGARFTISLKRLREAERDLKVLGPNRFKKKYAGDEMDKLAADFMTAGFQVEKIRELRPELYKLVSEEADGFDSLMANLRRLVFASESLD